LRPKGFSGIHPMARESREHCNIEKFIKDSAVQTMGIGEMTKWKKGGGPPTHE
jgi:hypothetical protein